MSGGRHCCTLLLRRGNGKLAFVFSFIESLQKMSVQPDECNFRFQWKWGKVFYFHFVILWHVDRIGLRYCLAFRNVSTSGFNMAQHLVFPVWQTLTNVFVTSMYLLHSAVGDWERCSSIQVICFLFNELNLLLNFFFLFTLFLWEATWSDVKDAGLMDLRSPFRIQHKCHLK